MMSICRNSLISRRAVFLGLAVSPSLLAVPAIAQDAPGVRPAGSQHTWLFDRSMAAGRAAAQFSDEPNHIGVVVFYGRDVDPAHVGDAFASELQRRGVNARSFAAPVNGTGASVHYQVGETGLGPLGVNTAAARMSEAVELSRARDRVLSPGYAPPRR